MKSNFWKTQKRTYSDFGQWLLFIERREMTVDKRNLGDVTVFLEVFLYFINIDINIFHKQVTKMFSG